MKTIITTAIIAAALSTTAAFAGGDNAAAEQRAKLNALWGKNVTPAVSAQVSATRGAETAGVLDGLGFSKDKGSNQALRNLRSSQPSRAGR